MTNTNSHVLKPHATNPRYLTADLLPLFASRPRVYVISTLAYDTETKRFLISVGLRAEESSPETFTPGLLLQYEQAASRAAVTQLIVALRGWAHDKMFLTTEEALEALVSNVVRKATYVRSLQSRFTLLDLWAKDNIDIASTAFSPRLKVDKL